MLAAKIRASHPERVPIILEVAKRTRGGGEDLPPLKNEKILVPAEYTVGKMMLQIRSQMALRPDTALFLFVGRGTLPATGALVGQVYDRYRDADNFLYVTIASESTFG